VAWGNRKAERVHLDHPVRVNLMGIDGAWQRSCVLVDVSETGAKLEVHGSLDILKAGEFFLILSSTGLAFRRCELVRIDGSAVGVRFIADKKAGAHRVVSK